MTITAEVAQLQDDLKAMGIELRGQMGYVTDPHRRGRRTASVYRVPPAALDDARIYIGCEHPVRVAIRRMKSARGQYMGTHFHRGAVEHRITLASDLTVFQADQTLYHELRHAHQRELLGEDRFYEIYIEQVEALGFTEADFRAGRFPPARYSEHQLEREAVYAERFATSRPICELR